MSDVRRSDVGEGVEEGRERRKVRVELARKEGDGGFRSFFDAGRFSTGTKTTENVVSSDLEVPNMIFGAHGSREETVVWFGDLEKKGKRREASFPP